jgi:hypothetical protein
MRFFALLLLAATSHGAEPWPETAPAGPVIGARYGHGHVAGAGAQTTLGETILSPRIRNITRLHNSMPHQLIGIGIVTGLRTPVRATAARARRCSTSFASTASTSRIADVVGGTTHAGDADLHVAAVRQGRPGARREVRGA